MILKICNLCNKEPALSNFKGKSGKCRECRNFILRQQRLVVKDKINEKNREQYIKHKDRFRKTQKKYEQKKAILERTDKIRHAKYLIQAARARSRRLKLQFSITYLDIPIPECCPILGIKLYKNNKISYNSATVDRIIPEKGYIKGNVMVISCKANQIKNNGTPDEILKVGVYFKNLLGDKDESRSETKVEGVTSCPRKL